MSQSILQPLVAGDEIPFALPARGVCDAKPDGCHDEHLTVSPHYSIAAAVSAIRGDGRVPSSNQEQMDEEGHVWVGCD